MTWRNPDVEVHATGWSAVIIVAAIWIAGLSALVKIVFQIIN